MGFYDLSKEERGRLVERMKEETKRDLDKNSGESFKKYASDSDSHIRKNAYLILGRFYRDRPALRGQILRILKKLFQEEDEKIRQTVVYCFGEIGKIDAGEALPLLERGLNDKHHSVRNAVTGALKRMGQESPNPTLEFAKKFQHHPDPEVRRHVIHGIELRGRTHPDKILPILKKSENDEDKKVRDMIVHVLSQVSYKEGCLEKVIAELKKWDNKELVERALKKIIEVHERYEKFSAKTSEEAREYIENEFENFEMKTDS